MPPNDIPTHPDPEPRPERATGHDDGVDTERHRADYRLRVNHAGALATASHPSSADHPPEPDPTEGWETSDLLSAGVLDIASTDPPVPVSVWRADGSHEPPLSPADVFTGFTRRLAGMLLATWTDRGDTVVDAILDPAVAGAAEAGGRYYRTLALPPSPPLAKRLAGRAALVLLRWPPGSLPSPAVTEHRPKRPPSPAAVLEACRDLLRPDGHTVIVLAPPTGRGYRDYARLMVRAARAAGLGYLQHVIVITAHQAPPAPTLNPDGPSADSGSPPLGHLDLLIFVIRRTSPSSGS